MSFEAEKKVVRDFMSAFDVADTASLEAVLRDHTSPNYRLRSVHPFYEMQSVSDAAATLWRPMRESLKHLQRREDIFFAGDNIVPAEEGLASETDKAGVWTCSMGHFLGLLDQDWLGIPATQKMAFLPYAEFHQIVDGRIAQSALFLDIINVMQQAGRDPFPHQTGAAIVPRGPRTHDGILLDETPAQEGRETLDLLDRMVDDLMSYNGSSTEDFPREGLVQTWHEDMIWYGPAGIGTTYTIDRYQQQHQYPFRRQLTDKVFNGHVTRIAEGNYCGWFGWPNLNNRNLGGFLGLPASDVNAEMRVVDIYRREGDKLSENWVFIDILYYLMQHGIDLLNHPNAVKDLHGAAR